MTTYTIEWDGGYAGKDAAGALVVTDADGNTLYVVQHDEPITAQTDAWDVVNRFTWGKILGVDHDGKLIHVTVGEPAAALEDVE